MRELVQVLKNSVFGVAPLLAPCNPIPVWEVTSIGHSLAEVNYHPIEPPPGKYITNLQAKKVEVVINDDDTRGRCIYLY